MVFTVNSISANALESVPPVATLPSLQSREGLLYFLESGNNFMVFIVHDVCDILCDVGEATRKTCGWPLWFLGSLSATK